jgi:transcriptional regulator with XRE-family HTH domain
MRTQKPPKPTPLKTDPAVSEYYRLFAARLKELRDEANLTQDDLCELIDIPLASYKHMEGTRASKFPLHKIGRLSSALHRSCDYIVTGRDKGHLKRVV